MQAYLDHSLVAQLLLICLLEVEAAVVQGLVVVLLEDLGEQGLHVLLYLTPLPILLLQPGQHHRDGHPWVLLQQVHNLSALLTCKSKARNLRGAMCHPATRRSDMNWFLMPSCTSQ